MPNVYAHYLAADRALARCTDERLSEIIARHRRAYNLGAQGPDLFYFHRAWPWTPSDRLSWMSNDLHRRNLRGFYTAASSYIARAPAARRDVLTAYLCGYANHQALDATAHPYVIYRTGDFTRGGAAARTVSWRHGRMEVTMDVLLLRQEKGRRPAWLIGQKLLTLDDGDAGALADFYAEVTPLVYGRAPGRDQVVAATLDAERIAPLLFDDGPSLRWALVRVVAALDRSRRVHRARYRRVEHDTDDYLNSARAAWYLPWDGDTPQHTSFVDMLDAAANSAVRMMTILGNAILDGRPLDGQQLDNRSLDTGLDCDDQRALTVFAPGLD